MGDIPSEDIALHLVARNVGQLAGDSPWAIFIGDEPQFVNGKTPQEVITVYDTSGLDPEVRWNIDKPSVQVRIRAAIQGYPGGYTKAKEISNVLHNLHAQVINGTKYNQILQSGGINSIGRDENDRPLFTVNFRMSREVVPGDHRLTLPS